MKVIFFSSSTTIVYQGIPFSKKDSQIDAAGCSAHEITCNEEEGQCASQRQSVTAAIALGTGLLAGLVGIDRLAQVGNEAISIAKAPTRALAILGAAVAIAVTATTCLYRQDHTTYSPKLEIWCQAKDIDAATDALKYGQELLESTVQELSEDDKKSKTLERLLLRKIETSTEELKKVQEEIATSAFVLAFIESTLPLLDQSQKGAWASIEQCIKDYQQYRQIESQEGGFLKKAYDMIAPCTVK